MDSDLVPFDKSAGCILQFIMRYRYLGLRHLLNISESIKVLSSLIFPYGTGLSGLVHEKPTLVCPDLSS